MKINEQLRTEFAEAFLSFNDQQLHWKPDANEKKLKTPKQFVLASSNVSDSIINDFLS